MKTRKLFSFLVVVALMFGGFVFKPTPAKAIKNFTVEVTPATVGMNAEYKFQFTIEKPIRVHEYIKFNFPQGTTFTPPLPKNDDEKIKRLEEITKSIYFCGDESPHDYDSCKSLPYITLEADGSLSIKIVSWLELDPAKEGYRDLCMKITKEAGITNPGTPGAFTYRMATQAEPTGAESKPVLIKDKAIESKFIVEVSPNGAGEIAEYKFSFKTEKELYVHNRVYLVFPPEVFVPETPDTENKENHERIWEMMNNIEINGETYLSCGSIPRSKKLADNSTELSLTTNHQRYIPGENDRVVIVFKPKFGIQNPKTPCNIKFKVKTEWSDSTFMESQPVEIAEKGKEEKPDLPDSLHANVWFSNPVKSQVTNMLVHIPLEVTNLCCFELRLLIPMDKLDMSAYFSKGNVTKENQDFFLNHVFLNGKTLKESTTSASRIHGISDQGRLYLEIVPTVSNVSQIDILFDKVLQIKLLQEGVLIMNDSRIFVSSTTYKNGGKEIKLIFPDNYIFPEEK